MQRNSVNKAIIVGRLGEKPELRYTGSGSAVCNVSVATSDVYKETETTEWHRVVLFGKSAEFAAQYLDKGALVYVDGKLQTRSWEKDGHKHYTTEIVAQTITPLSKGRETANTAQETISDDEPLPF